MKMQLQRLSLALLAVLALACEGGDPRPILKVGVNGTSFQRETVPSTATSPIAYVPVMTWNRGDATAFLPGCGAKYLPGIEKLVDGSWQPYAVGFCAAVISGTPVELRAGESRNDQVAIGDAGHFRIHVSYWADASGEHRDDALSSEFDVQ